jgi:hypothetical protein
MSDPEQDFETFDNGLAQVLSTLLWAEANVPGTNFQSDIIMLRDVLQPRLSRLRSELEAARVKTDEYAQAYTDAKAEVERLRAALNRAGDRLAQVQPGVTEPWAFDIVPKAEQEIADALAEEKE